MNTVMKALIIHEFREKTRDRWILVVSFLFVALNFGAGLYGQQAGEGAALVIGPSMVTLSSLLVPLVALLLGYDAITAERERKTLDLLLSMPIGGPSVILGKFLGRFLALVFSLVLGFGASMILSDIESIGVLLKLIIPSLLLGASFLALGIFLSSCSRRPATAASLLVATWFLLVFFYDLGILGVMVATDGALGMTGSLWLVSINPVGMYRLMLMSELGGTDMVDSLSKGHVAPSMGVACIFCAVWIMAPLIASFFTLRWSGRKHE